VGLREYERKRDFSVTPEPRGARPRPGGRRFCVQKHAASHLHYDFRLELDGVLLSWAVPKGPSLAPADKRLAMQTEDHPVEYADFEGVIPEGEYGGGTVLLWDQGVWEPVGDARQAYRAGALKFILRAQKLRGGFALVRIRARDAREDGRSWLLIKEKDEDARPGYRVVDEEPLSVVSGRSLEEIAAARDRVWHSNVPAQEQARSMKRPPAVARASARAPAPSPADPRSVPQARRAALPAFVPPQLATLVDRAPAGDEWLHEMKLDGYRILARLQRGRVRLLSRRDNDWSERFPEVGEAVSQLPASQALLDGEVAVVLPDGITSFQALQSFGKGSPGRLVYFAFDLLHLDGYDLTRSPLESRKAVLRELLAAAPAPAADVLAYSEHVAGSGPDFFAEACRLRLEGVVSKRRNGPYQPGRGRDWLKVKCVRTQEVVIGGYTPPKGARTGLGALLVGVYDEPGRLRYGGKVGTGFSDTMLRDLKRRLDRLKQPTSPFADRAPRAAGVTWVRPELVAEVAFTEWTSDGRLRHPSFRGLREDKEPLEATAVDSRQSTVDRDGGDGSIQGVKLTHPKRVLYPAYGTTKRDLALFYESIADWILPHLKGRPTTLVRCPEGLEGGCFYQKHSGQWAPASLRRVKIQEAKKVGEYLVVDDLAGLIGLVQIGILEIHTWNSVADHLEQPDRMVFDLDPDDALPWTRTIEAAERVREELAAVDLTSFVKTTGGKGLHVVVPLQRGPGWEEVAAFAEGLAVRISAQDPAGYTAVMSKAKRKGKVFIDYLRNHRGATSVAAYSTRAKPSAPVSTPLRWEELGPELRSDHFTIANIRERLSSLKADPWAGYDQARQRLTRARVAKLARRGVS
jgi:bifunctional non-homologous end joining protein LigD